MEGQPMERSEASVEGAPVFAAQTKEIMNFIRGGGGWEFLGRWLRWLAVMAAMAGAAVCCSGQMSLDPVHFDLSRGDQAAVNGLPVMLASDALNGAPALGSTMDLPDAPEPQQQGKPDPDANKPLVAAVPKTVSETNQMPVAPKFSKYIPAGYAVEQIHGKEKLVMGARDLISVGNVGDWLLSAGWEQLWDSQPNYGTDRGAFGERLGAAAIRESTEGILTDGVFDIWLHEDPRYFVQGSQFGIVHRAVYAASRVAITRSSTDGHAKPNYGLWLGQAGAIALTNAYYPQKNRDFDDNWHRYVGALAGSAGGYVFDEFMGDLKNMLHHKGH
jgi:hypothetical protein